MKCESILCDERKIKSVLQNRTVLSNNSSGWIDWHQVHWHAALNSSILSAKIQCTEWNIVNKIAIGSSQIEINKQSQSDWLAKCTQILLLAL